MSDATARATDVIGEVSGLSAEECAEIADALTRADLLAEPLDGFEATSEVQEWVMIPADQVHDEWAVERPDPVDRQPRYDRFPTLDAALSERWGNDRAVHRVATGWEPVDRDEVAAWCEHYAPGGECGQSTCLPADAVNRAEGDGRAVTHE